MNGIDKIFGPKKSEYEYFLAWEQKLSEEGARLAKEKEEWRSSQRESEVWLRFACAALTGLDTARDMRDEGAEIDDITKHCADIADAMLDTAKRKGKV